MPQPPKSYCSCGIPKKRWELACKHCWRLLPLKLRNLVYHLFREQQGSDEHIAAVKECYKVLKVERAKHPRTCRVCGCTDDNCSECVKRTGKPCHWVEADLCSACQ